MPCGNLGTPEILIIAVIILVLFGAKRLPALARSIGSGINEFKKGLNTSASEIDDHDLSTKDVNKKQPQESC